MRYTDQPGEYSDRDATTAAPVPEAEEGDWSPLGDDESDVVADGGGGVHGQQRRETAESTDQATLDTFTGDST